MGACALRRQRNVRIPSLSRHFTTALENGAHLEDVQKAAGHRDPRTTNLYDRRGYNPEKAGSFFCEQLTAAK
jgi:hypothetical protein